MVTRVSTVAVEGIDARPVDVQVQISPGNVAFTIVGLADNAVAESRERVRSALIASGLALPAKRITVNLAPADLPKEGRCQVSWPQRFTGEFQILRRMAWRGEAARVSRR
jgi:magnesium chelatase family protein